MEFKRPRLMVAAMRGGAGKTVVSVGLTAAWKRRLGLGVVAFKKGPDYIDAGWLSAASGRPCYNLDPFLMDAEQIVRSFVLRSARADGSLIEANRGLYDGSTRAELFERGACQASPVSGRNGGGRHEGDAHGRGHGARVPEYRSRGEHRRGHFEPGGR